MAKKKKTEIKVQSTAAADFFRKDNLNYLFIFLLTLLFFHKLLSFSHMVFGTDWLASTYMFKKYIKDYFANYNEIPMWLTYVYGGVPLNANFGDTFYPFSIILRTLFPVHVFAALLYIVQIFLAGFFTYVYLRYIKLGKFPSFIGAVSFMFGGWLISLIYAGHEGRMAISSYLPALLFAIHYSLDKRKLVYFILAGGILGFSLLIPHIQMNYYLLMAVFFYFLFRLYFIWKEDRKALVWVKYLFFFIIFLAVGFSLAAIVYIPFASYVPLSPRGGEGRGFEYSSSWPLNPEELINLAIPDFSGILENYWGRNFFKLHTEYVGVLPLLLAVIVIVNQRKNRYVIFFIFLSLIALSIGLGAHTPLYRLYYEIIPGFKRFRAPAMIFFVISFSIAALTALGLENILSRIGKNEENKKLFKALIWTAVVFLVLTLLVATARSFFISVFEGLFVKDTVKIRILEQNYPHFISGTVKFYTFLLVNILLLFLVLKKGLSVKLYSLISTVILLIDLWIVDYKFVKTVSGPEIFFSPDAVASFLEKDKSHFRVFGPQYRNDNYLSLFGIQNIAGEHGNQPLRYNQLLGVNRQKVVDYHNLGAPNVINLTNLKYLISRSPINHPNFELVQNGSYLVYENREVYPRAFLVYNYEVIVDPDSLLNQILSISFNPKNTVLLEQKLDFRLGPADTAALVHLNSYIANKIELSVATASPAMLIILDNYYPDWEVFVDGRKEKLYLADYTFRGVYLPAGQHKVELKLSSKSYRWGKTISFLTAIFLIGTLFFIYTLPRLKRKTSDTA